MPVPYLTVCGGQPAELTGHPVRDTYKRPDEPDVLAGCGVRLIRTDDTAFPWRLLRDALAAVRSGLSDRRANFPT
jgi:hypothetical protein